MVIRKRPELDTKNPPGQVVNRTDSAALYKPVHGGFPSYTKPKESGKLEIDNGAGFGPFVDTEEMFTPRPRAIDGCCHRTVTDRCDGCPYAGA